MNGSCCAVLFSSLQISYFAILCCFIEGLGEIVVLSKALLAWEEYVQRVNKDIVTNARAALLT